MPQYALPRGPRPIPIIFFDVSTTQGPFTVPNLGGEYGITVTGTFNGGSVTLEKLSRYGVTGVAVLPAFTGLLDVRNGYRAFLAGLSSPLDALPRAASSSGSTEQRPSSRPDLQTRRQRAQ